MAEQTFSRRNLDFLLFEVLQVAELIQHEYFKANDLLKLFTPVVKTFGAEMGFIAINQAMRKFQEVTSPHFTIAAQGNLDAATKPLI